MDIKKSTKELSVKEEKVKRVINFINNKLPLPKSIEEKEYNELDDFSVCINSCGDNWYLGYSALSIIPPDIKNKQYYIGGNISIPPRKAKGIIDDIKVRTICLSVGAAGEKTVFSSIDCIGITNIYVKKIREEMSDFCIQNNIKAINIFSTHTHSSIDTMGIWSVSLRKFVVNVRALHKNKCPNPSVDVEYLNFVIGKIKSSIYQAVKSMHPGKLFFLKFGSNSADAIRETVYKKIGFDKYTDVWNKDWENVFKRALSNISVLDLGLYEYILPKRSPYEFSPCVARIRFEPFDKNQKGTVIVNLSAHPYSNGLKIKNQWKGNCLSGDFPYYMEKFFNENNYNFLFVNGSINGIYPKRESTKIGTMVASTIRDQTETIGYDFARLALIADMQTNMIYSNKMFNPKGKSNVYKSIIERHKKIVKEKEIKPVLYEFKKNISLRCSNPIEEIIGKLNFSQFNAYNTKDGIYLKSEIGYIQLGESLRIALIPGEITAGLFTGKGDMVSKNTLYQNTAVYNSISDIWGQDTLVFGLANDEIGYVIPDSDYCMFFIGNGWFGKKLLGANYTHYQELFSLGKNTASELMNQMESMREDVEEYLNNNCREFDE